MRGRVIKVNLARPMKGPVQQGGNRAGAYPTFPLNRAVLTYNHSLGVRRVASTKC